MHWLARTLILLLLFIVTKKQLQRRTVEQATLAESERTRVSTMILTCTTGNFAFLICVIMMDSAHCRCGCARGILARDQASYRDGKAQHGQRQVPPRVLAGEAAHNRFVQSSRFAPSRGVFFFFDIGFSISFSNRFPRRRWRRSVAFCWSG
jgi:hypothetical protein